MGWTEEEEEDEVTTREAITDEENERLKSITSTDGQDYRGIRKETNIYFGVRYEYDQETGELLKQYVPTTIGGLLVGYRVRKMPKDFTQSIGQVGKECDMVFQHRFKHSTHTCVISGGEVKALVTYQMLKDDIKRRGKSYDPPAVVCSTLGESGAHKQVASNYEFFDQFQKIIICMDADAAGKEAVDKIAAALPNGKAFVMNMRYKDADEYLLKGEQQAFLEDYWNAKPYVPSGVKSADVAFDELPDELNMVRISLPSYMHKLQKMMGGGIRQGRIVNIIADTSVGKTTQVRRMVHHWLFDSPTVPTIVSLEDTAAQYMIDLIGIHIQENLMWNKTEAEIVEWLKTDDGKRVRQELCFKEDGTPRFYIIDERHGSIKEIEAYMEVLYKKYGSRMFVIDVLTDLLRGSNEDYAEDHMNFQKGFIKDGATIINVHHTRKPQQTPGAKPRKVTEYDALGTGSFVQSGAYNIVLNRDKLAEDLIERNTTEVDLPKCRGGKTGPAGQWYYDFPTVKCYDLEDWLAKNGPKEY